MRSIRFLLGTVASSLLLATPPSIVTAFAPSSSSLSNSKPSLASSTTKLQDTADSGSLTSVQDYLAQNHGLFWKTILQKNDAVWKQLREAADAPTIFAPTDEAMQQLGDTKLQQLADIRNEETVLKMGAFHAVTEGVSAAELFDSGGVVTVAGVIPVERSVSGGMFGIGGKEDGGVTVGGARVVETVTVAGGSIVHRTDDLVSPSILWRYCDQLRIPGSK